MRSRYIIGTEELGTNFIFDTHFAGKRRERDRYNPAGRSFSIIIPDEDYARMMMEDGFDVRTTKPRPGYEEDFEPEYYVNVYMKYKSENGASDPVVNLIKEDFDGKYSVPLDEHTVGNLDDIRIKRNSVRAVLSPYTKGGGDHPTLYLQILYVEQDTDSDPWARAFPQRRPAD